MSTLTKEDQKGFLEYYLAAQAESYYQWLSTTPFFKHPKLIALSKFLEEAYQTRQVIPRKIDLFRALRLTPLHRVKVVILGQDPYLSLDKADGLAFSTPNGNFLPGSLRNIFRCLYQDLGTYRINSDLRPWAEQGVLLLNTSFTTEPGRPNGHQNLGWHLIVNAILTLINRSRPNVCYCLWGSAAQEKRWLITDKKALIIESAHPSPNSAHLGFLEHKPFSRINDHLKKHYSSPIIF